MKTRIAAGSNACRTASMENPEQDALVRTFLALTGTPGPYTITHALRRVQRLLQRDAIARMPPPWPDIILPQLERAWAAAEASATRARAARHAPAMDGARKGRRRIPGALDGPARAQQSLVSPPADRNKRPRGIRPGPGSVFKNRSDLP